MLDPEQQLVPQLIGLVLAAAIGAWVMNDALQRGKSIRDAFLWGLGVWLLLIVFLPLWFLTRPSLGARVRQGMGAGGPQPFNIPQLCRYCGQPSGEDPFYCAACGRQLKGVGDTSR